MPKQRSELEAAAGQLILAVQKEWESDFFEGSGPENESVMGTCHELLQAAKANSIASLLAGRSVAQYLGESWVGRHPRVIPAVKQVQLLIKGKHAV
jgi:hypothetical protein